MESLSTRTQTLSRAQIISDEQLEHYHWLLCAALKNKSDPSQILQKVYGNCYGVWTTIDRSPVEKDQFLERVKNSDTQKQFFETLKKATNTPPNRKNLEDLFFHEALQPPPPPPSQAQLQPGSEPPAAEVIKIAQNKAIEDSWNAEFIDLFPLDSLVDHISCQLKDEQVYGRYCSIVQSSGMGKSRLLDEFSKHFFMIPINLRSPGSKGYPPPDDDVRHFLTTGSIEPQDVSRRIENFLVALFDEATETVTRLGNNQFTRIQGFREFMSKDQRMGFAGSCRREFYKRVVDKAGTLPKTEKPSGDGDHHRGLATREQLNKLRTALNDGATGSSQPEERWRFPQFPGHITELPKESKFVDVFIAFDEAHTLARTINTANESCFVVLRRMLSSLSLEPLYTFFLSTTGSITQFAQPRGQDSSNRINSGTLSTPRPYIYLGFDQLMQSRKILERWTTLKDVTSLECAAHMGRPLWGTRYDHGDYDVRRTLIDFAQEKLLCTVSDKLSPAQIYAVLSQRLALDTNTPQYLFHRSANPLGAMQSMHEQIANHMRVCVAIENGIESLRGIASSEPILSEAASRIMITKKFSLPGALSEILGGYCIDQGERGELIVASFFTWARDQVVKSQARVVEQLCPYFSVKQLFERLFNNTQILDDGPSICHPKDSPKPFKEVFGDAMMHFNHVIKPQNRKTLRRSYLLPFMARGAAALGANCQPGFDAVYPYLYGTTDLDIRKLGFIIVQVKNDSTKYAGGSLDDLFMKMDPFKCNLIDNSDKEDGRFPIPIVRIVFLLSGNDTYVKQHTYLDHAKYRNPSFTSYDYVCAGVDSSNLRPVEDSSWKALVNERDPWENFYPANPAASAVVRSQLPANASHEGHYKSWYPVSKLPC